MTNAKLVFHTEHHSEEKNFKCEVCSKAFYENRYLEEHVAIVHGDIPKRFSCNFCLKTSMLKQNIKSHILVCKKTPTKTVLDTTHTGSIN